MEGESVGSTGSDPLQAVADAMDAAVNAAKEGVEGARASATEVLPAINGFLSRRLQDLLLDLLRCGLPFVVDCSVDPEE